MTPPAPPARRAGPWPLLAIALLVVLLTAFVVLRMRNRERDAAVVLKPPPPPEPVAVEAPPPPPTPEPPPAPPAPPPAPENVVVDDPLPALLEKAVKALDEKRWKDAEALLAEAAAQAKADDPSLAAAKARLDAGKKAEEEARLAAEKAKAEALARRRQALDQARERAEKAREQNHWDAALAELEKALAAHPELATDAEFVDARDRIRRFRDESDGYYAKALAEARTLFDEGRFAPAFSAAERALAFYPERGTAVRDFQAKVREARLAAEMVRIPDVGAWVGSDDHPDERPLRSVKLPPFYLDRHPVTNEDFQAFVQATGHAAPPGWQGKTYPKGRGRHPVVFVTWDDAKAYAEWAGKRLPTAEEWEVAARGPDRREYPWGGAFSEKENVFHANCLEYWQVNKQLAPGTTPVDHVFPANGESAFRVQGMGGNVWEWTASAAPAGSADRPVEYRILKGGSFMTPARALRCANVLFEDPRIGHPDVGFRCARDAK